jgi:hypothetical protein
MSLQQFLVVGRSFATSPNEKSPFEMRKDVRLPTFDNAPRLAPRSTVAVQADWLEEKRPIPLPAEPFAPKTSTMPRSGPRRKRGWLEILSLGVLGKPHLSGELVQGEMNLEKVRVIRNDLADSDLELIVNKKKKFAFRKVEATLPKQPAKSKTPEPKQREEWSELTARLFEIGQH